MTLAGVEELDDVLASPVFGGGLPPRAENLLKEAGERYERADEALALLREARKIAPDHFAVLIGLYRFFFYKGRLTEARDVAETCLLRAAIENSLPLDWRLVRRGDASFDSYDAPLARFFIFVLKGYAYLQHAPRRPRGGARGDRQAPRARSRRQGRRAPSARRARATGGRR